MNTGGPVSPRRASLFGFATTGLSLVFILLKLGGRNADPLWRWPLYATVAMWSGAVLLDLAYGTGLLRNRRKSAQRARGAIAAHALGLGDLFLGIKHEALAIQIWGVVVLMAWVVVLCPYAQGWFQDFRRGFHDPPL